MVETRGLRAMDQKRVRVLTLKGNDQAQADASVPSAPFLLSVFCVCVFVVLGRPQDVCAFIVPLRPAFLLEMVTFICLLFNYSSIASGISFGNRQVKLFAALIAVMAVSIPFAYHRGVAFEFVTDFLKLGLFFLLFFVIADSTDSVKSILKAGCIGVAMYTVFALAMGIEDRIIATGGMFDANDLCFVIISFLPFNFLFLEKTNPFYMKIMSLLSVGLGSLAVLMTGSRGGFVSLLFVFAMLLFFRTRTIKFSAKVAFVVLCLVLVSFKGASIDFARLGTTFSPGSDYNVTEDWGRKDIWERGTVLMLTHPLTGVGAGCFDMAIGLGRKEEGKIPKWQTAHNSFLQIGAETGLVGLGLFLLLSLSAYRAFSGAAKKGSSEDIVRIGEMARIGFVGQMIAGIFLSQAYSPYWVFYIALSAVLIKLRGEEAVPSGVDEKAYHFRPPMPSRRVTR